LEGRGITGSPIRSAKDVAPKWEETNPELVVRDYLDEKTGVSLEDWWNVDIINQSSRERLGYPTQKPEALLERIIRASSNEGDTVLDAYCGCGTTVAVAQKFKRKWIGIDITYQSISLILKRLEDTYGSDIIGGVELNGIPRDMASVAALAQKEDDRTRKEFEKWAVLTYSDNRAIINEKKGSDKGIDGVAFIADTGGNPQKVLFSVKSGKAGVSHVRDLRGTVEREGAAGGILITLNPPTRDMTAEAASAGDMENIAVSRKTPKIKIVAVGELLDGERMTLPLAYEVLKKAQRDRGKNKDLDFG
jgi:site-specific DNA-methyltransferase (adenine-specific)